MERGKGYRKGRHWERVLGERGVAERALSLCKDSVVAVVTHPVQVKHMFNRNGNVAPLR